MKFIYKKTILDKIEQEVRKKSKALELIEKIELNREEFAELESLPNPIHFNPNFQNWTRKVTSTNEIGYTYAGIPVVCETPLTLPTDFSECVVNRTYSVTMLSGDVHTGTFIRQGLFKLSNSTLCLNTNFVTRVVEVQ